MSKQKIVLSRSLYGGTWSLDEWDNEQPLSMIGEVFEEGSYYLTPVIEELQVGNSTGIGGNKIHLSFQGNLVMVEPLYSDDPDKYAASIDKNVLISLIRAWQKLVKHNPTKMTIYQDGNVFTLEAQMKDGSTLKEVVF